MYAAHLRVIGKSIADFLFVKFLLGVTDEEL